MKIIINTLFILSFSTSAFAISFLGLVTSEPLLSSPQSSSLDQKGATVRMNIGKYAKISELDDFVLRTTDEDGSAGAVYDGSDIFQLESNCAVQVDMEGEQLSNGSYSLSTNYKLDDKETIETAPGIHKAQHKVSAQAQLGNISSQEAGDYSAKIVLTVSAID